MTTSTADSTLSPPSSMVDKMAEPMVERIFALTPLLMLYPVTADLLAIVIDASVAIVNADIQLASSSSPIIRFFS